MMNRDPLTADRSATGPPAPETGRAYWRSLEELAEAGSSRDDQFPTFAADLMRRAGTVDRRRFLELMAASIGLAGLAGCRRPESHILPY
ncbi:MAG: TAT-variant-translocated molybdopterin oxidoreductase, partial [Isosphaeraceae bacterium]